MSEGGISMYRIKTAAVRRPPGKSQCAGGILMTGRSIYDDIADRTNGEFMIGVTGPVRTGKSTFIKRFIESAVLPRMEGEYERTQLRDELPQSAGGRTVMTAEPKFIPDEAASVALPSGGTLKMKMIDCVGYLVPSALGAEENGEVRMVHTPWDETPKPFEEAAEEGTRRVIRDHSTIGILVTSDGSFGDIARDDFVDAEERVARELRESGKPFVLVVNSAHPDSPEAEALALELEAKYDVPAALVDCTRLDEEDVLGILELVLSDFPVREISVNYPEWVNALDDDHWLKRLIFASCVSCASGIRRMGDVPMIYAASLADRISEGLGEKYGRAEVSAGEAKLGSGESAVSVSLGRELYYETVSHLTGLEIDSEKSLLSALIGLAETKRDYEKYAEALDMVNERGYGIVMPEISDLRLEEPEIVKQAGGYGVRLRAKAPSIHMIRASIETEINPIVGTEEQSEEIVNYMLHEFEEEPVKIWESNLFGKSLYELVNEGLHAKLEHMPEDAREKFGETLSRIINEGSGGLICIIL